MLVVVKRRLNLHFDFKRVFGKKKEKYFFDLNKIENEIDVNLLNSLDGRSLDVLHENSQKRIVIENNNASEMAKKSAEIEYLKQSRAKMRVK